MCEATLAAARRTWPRHFTALLCFQGAAGKFSIFFPERTAVLHISGPEWETEYRAGAALPVRVDAHHVTRPLLQQRCVLGFRPEVGEMDEQDFQLVQNKNSLFASPRFWEEL